MKWSFGCWEEKSVVQLIFWDIKKGCASWPHEIVFFKQKIGLTVDSLQLVTSYRVGKCSNKALKQFPFQGHAYFFRLGIIKELIDEQQENVQKAFIQFPSSYTVRPKFEKYIIE